MDEAKNYHDAEKYCQEQGMMLLSIDSDSENQYIIAQLNAMGECNGFECHRWTAGVRVDNSNTNWKWGSSSGESWPAHPTDPNDQRFRNWANGEPNSPNSEKCLHLWHGRGWAWNDLPCGRKIKFICEVKRV